jgi:hypothetical protein
MKITVLFFLAAKSKQLGREQHTSETVKPASLSTASAPAILSLSL